MSSKLEKAEAKRSVVEHLLSLQVNDRNTWLLSQDGKYHMYQEFTTQELKEAWRQLSQEIIGLQAGKGYYCF